MFNSQDVSQICAEAADAKKAFDILILDLRQLTYITDYFVICSGGSTTQVGAIADEIGHVLAKDGVHPSHVEGGADSHWVLMDFGDVVVHIFEEQTRQFYCLEKLWGDAPRIPASQRARTLTSASS